MALASLAPVELIDAPFALEYLAIGLAVVAAFQDMRERIGIVFPVVLAFLAQRLGQERVIRAVDMHQNESIRFRACLGPVGKKLINRVIRLVGIPAEPDFG